MCIRDRVCRVALGQRGIVFKYALVEDGEYRVGIYLEAWGDGVFQTKALEPLGVRSLFYVGW